MRACAHIGLPVVSGTCPRKGWNMHHARHDVRPRFSALSSAIAESLHTALATARRPQAIAVKSAFISASTGILVTSALAVGIPARVAAQAAAAPVEEVSVTGSRIRREGFKANAHVVQVGEAVIDKR